MWSHLTPFIMRCRLCHIFNILLKCREYVCSWLHLIYVVCGGTCNIQPTCSCPVVCAQSSTLLHCVCFKTKYSQNVLVNCCSIIQVLHCTVHYSTLHAIWKQPPYNAHFIVYIVYCSLYCTLIILLSVAYQRIVYAIKLNTVPDHLRFEKVFIKIYAMITLNMIVYKTPN